MVRALRRRPRSDKLENEKRKPGGNWGRKVYLGLLAVFAIAMLNYLWGDFFIYRGDGQVLRDQNVIAASYIARIAEVNVEEGQTVKKGDVLLQIESTEVLERLADLSIRQAEMTQRAAEFQIRSEVATKLLPLATRREKETSAVLLKFDVMADRGLLTSARYEEALKANFDAREDHVKLAAENNTLKRQISALESARRDAAAAIGDLQLHYANGVVRAANDGSVDAKTPSVGNVYRAGEPILSIFSGQAYVLTYLPDRYFFPIYPGMKVVISSGRHKDEGVITEILPVSDALPKEFQNTFKPQDRNQLAKIKLSNPAKFPAFAKVKITRPYF